jgi:hypothetical protein
MAQGQPPCHESRSGRSLSVNLNHGGWRCFGCDSTGDLVAYIQRRDGCDFKRACQTLGAWRDVSESERIQLDFAKAKRERERQQADAVKEVARRRRLDLRNEIHVTARIQRETSDRLSELRRGSPEAHPGETELCWELLALAHDDLRLTEAEYMREIER